MIRFACEYSEPQILQQPAAKTGSTAIVPQATAQLGPNATLAILQQLVAQLPWFYNIIFMEKAKNGMRHAFNGI